jgi:hypothetical protein
VYGSVITSQSNGHINYSYVPNTIKITLNSAYWKLGNLMRSGKLVCPVKLPNLQIERGGEAVCPSGGTALPYYTH